MCLLYNIVAEMYKYLYNIIFFKFYVIESSLYLLARQMLLLSISLEGAQSMGLSGE